MEEARICSEIRRGRDCLGNLGIVVRVILKWVLEKQHVMVFT